MWAHRPLLLFAIWGPQQLSVPRKAVEQTLPSVGSPQPSLCRQLSKTHLIIECLWPEGWIPTARSFCVQLISLLGLESEPVGGGLRFVCGVAGQDDAPQIFKMNSALPLLSKTAPSEKVKLLYLYFKSGLLWLDLSFLHQHQHLFTGVRVRGRNKALLSAQGNFFSYKDRRCFLKTPVEISLCNY